MLLWLQTTAGRALTGLGVMVALVLFLWPSNEWSFDPARFAACVVAFLAWVASLGGPTPPTPHDVQLLTRLREQITESTRSFLKSHDFDGRFSRSWVNELNALAYWHGAEFEFDNKRLQGRFKRVVQKTSEFTHFLGLNTWPTNMGDLSSAVPEVEDHGIGRSENTKERIRKLNADASDLLDTIDEFIRFARPRLHTRLS